MTLLNDIDVGGTKYKYANSIPMGTCATPAGSEVKECTFADSFELAVGNLISVTFTYANTYGDGSTTYPKLLINGTQYPVKQPVGGYASSGAWANGQAVTFMFDGTNLVFLTVPVVDTVTANNMNSVSSNAVANAINVSPVTNRWVFARLHTANTVLVSFTNQTAHFTRTMLDNVSNNETVLAVFASSSQSVPVLVTARFDSDGFTLWTPVTDSTIELQLWGIVSRS